MRRIRTAVVGIGSPVGDERGFALLAALGTMLVLTLTVTSIIFLTSANAGNTTRSNADQTAYALAEAGVNNAVSVLEANYPGTTLYPGKSTLLPTRTTQYDGGSVTWSGTLAGPLSSGSWRYEWRVTSIASVPNPTGPAASPVTRTVRAVVPVIIPPTLDTNAANPLNWLYSGTDMVFDNSAQIGSPVYATRDLSLQNTAQIRGSAHKLVVGRDLYLTSPQNQIGLVSGLAPADQRIGEAHVVHQCSSKAQPLLHACLWDADAVYATTHDNVIPPGIIATPSLTCCSPYAGSIAPAGTDNPSSMGFWYEYADLGPGSPCDSTTSTGMPPPFESAGNTAIDDSATPTLPVNLTPATSYTCESVPGTPTAGELSWNASSKVLTVKGTVFIDGSATISTGGVATYDGQATLVLSGTFDMKNSRLCAVVSSGNCDLSPGAWDPNNKALVVVADGDGGGGGAQSQAGEVAVGEGIHLKGASFQGALIANKAINVETSSLAQGPMISVYSRVLAGQSGGLVFPTIYFAPSGGAEIASKAYGALLPAQSFGG